MTIEMQTHLEYLFEQIRLNLDGNETLKETPRAHAWLLTTLALYGDQLTVLIDLYRLFREQNSYILLSFIIEHILQYHLQQIENHSYLQQEFQLIFSKSIHENDQFSYVRLHSLLSTSTREIISSLLIRKWYDELEENLLSSTKSLQILNQCREQALACLSLSSSSISSILQLILNTETKIGFHIQTSSLNILRCLFVRDLLPIVLENRQKLDIQSHICHQWLIHAIEFYLEYQIQSLKFSPNQPFKLEGNVSQTFQCENPLEEIEHLLQLAVHIQQNFNWQQFTHCLSTNRRQRLLELRLLIHRTHQSTIRCPFECFLFCTSFPIFIQSVIHLSNLFNKAIYRDYVFLPSTTSIKYLGEKQNQFHQVEFIEDCHRLIECLTFFQQSQTSTCLKLYQETIDKLRLDVEIPIYQRLLKIFYFYFLMEKSRKPKEKEFQQMTTIIIDDTPQSPIMQDDSIINSPLICPDIEHFLTQLNDQSLESRLQFCALSHQPHVIVSSCIDTLIYLHENYFNKSSSSELLLSISSDYSFLPPSYPLLFDYLLDLLLEHLPSTLILLQIRSNHSPPSIYPKHLFSALTPLSLRYIYDQKLLGQLLNYIQMTSKADRRWLTNTNKRKLDSEQKKLTDEQFIEKIIQHVSHITQWQDEQRREAIYIYLLDERQTLVQTL